MSVQTVWNELQLDSVPEITPGEGAGADRFDAADIDAPTIDGELATLPLGETAASVRAVAWDIPANGVYRLAVNNSPIRASWVSWSYGNIGWVAGRGWPLYSSPCPRGDRRSDMRFPLANAHAIVPMIGGYYIYGTCGAGSHASNRNDFVYWGVNDQPNQYGDNSGGFRLYLHGWR